MNSLNVLNRLVQLLKERNFVERCAVCLDCGSQQIIYNYGPAGALFRYNILSEWRKFSIQNAENENCFMIENSISSPTRQIELPTSNNVQVLKGLRSRLVQGCMEYYFEVLKQANKQLPFIIAQAGVCFRNHENHNSNKQQITSSFLFDASEVTDMTQLCFCSPNTLLWNFNNYQRRRLHWWRQFANSPSNFQISEIKQTSGSENLLLQSCRILYKFPWGWDTVENLINWGDGPLKKISSLNRVESVFAKHGRAIVIPAMIESSALLERGFLAFLLDSFRQKEKTKTNKNVTNIYNTDNIKCLLKLDNKLAPYKVAVTITGNKRREIRILALRVLKEVKSCYVSILGNVDVAGSLENQFNIFDQMGVPYTIIIKESSLDTGLVDVRSRDTTIKEPVHITEIKEYILRNLGLHLIAD